MRTWCWHDTAASTARKDFPNCFLHVIAARFSVVVAVDVTDVVAVVVVAVVVGVLVMVVVVSVVVGVLILAHSVQLPSSCDASIAFVAVICATA